MNYKYGVIAPSHMATEDVLIYSIHGYRLFDFEVS